MLLPSCLVVFYCSVFSLPPLNSPVELESLMSEEADGVLKAREEEEIQEVDQTQHS